MTLVDVFFCIVVFCINQTFSDQGVGTVCAVLMYMAGFRISDMNQLVVCEDLHATMRWIGRVYVSSNSLNCEALNQTFSFKLHIFLN